MNDAYRYLTTIALSLAALILLMWISGWQTINVSKVEVSNDNAPFQAASLPLSQNHLGTYTVRVSINGITNTTHQFRIYPDDEIHKLSINGKEISLSQFSTDQRRNYGSGFVIGIDGLKINDINLIEAELSNQSNPAGFRLESAQRFTYGKLLAIFLSLALLVITLTRHMKITKIQLGLVLLSLAISTLYLSKTDERTRTFDVFEGGGHKDYIEYLIEHQKLPIPGDGWEYHQPPLYYLTAALIKQTAPINSHINGELWGQLYALFLWTLFLVSSMATLRLVFIKRTHVLAFASIALCLWPAGIIHSIRIGNDLAIYACYGIAFFYITRWWKSRNSEILFWASLWMAASLVCKSNGLAVAGTLGVLILFHIYGLVRKPHLLQQHKAKLFRDCFIAGGLFTAAITLNFADNIKHYLDGTSEDWLLSNVSEMINPGLKVGNEIRNYLVFDSATFLEEPFISTWDDQYGRQYFLNFLLRSSLSSEYFFNGSAMEIWGTVNGILLLTMLMGSMIYFIQIQPTINIKRWVILAYRNAPWIMALIFPLILLIAYRIKVPLSCNTDFRYIYPTLLAILFFVMQSWNSSRSLPIPKLLTLAAPLIGINSLPWIFILLTQ